MKAANGVFVLSVEHDVVSCMPEGILGRKATVGDVANPEGITGPRKSAVESSEGLDCQI